MSSSSMLKNSKLRWFFTDFTARCVGVMAHPSGAAHTAVHGFLTNVLSQEGPNAVPYNQDVKWQIRTQLMTLVQEYPALTVKTALFTHNDGRTANLLQAEGTVPMQYQGIKYNIPVTIWLIEGYPRSGPLVYVTPTRDMIIKNGHRNVDSSGQVSVPYLREWVFPRSNLVDFVRQLSDIFGRDPPLYSRPPVGTVVRPPGSSGGSGGALHDEYNIPAFINPMHGDGSVSKLTQGRPGTRPPTVAPPVIARTDDPAEVFKRNAISTLTERLQADVAKFNKDVSLEMDRLIQMQHQLNERSQILEGGLQELRAEKEALESSLQLTLTNTDVMETWLEANDKGPMEVNIDEAFQAADGLSKQLLNCIAADLALDDVIYSLDRALQNDKISSEVYLKNIRNLSREQFVHRATAIKVRALQAQVLPQSSYPP